MPGKAWLIVAIFMTQVILADASSHFGYCVINQPCDWSAYWTDVILRGLGGWVIAGIIFVFLVVYIIVKTVRCCCRGCRLRGVNTPHRAKHLVMASRIVRGLVVFAGILAIAGFIVVMVGWGNLDQAWGDILNIAQQFYGYLTTLQNLLQQVLTAIKSLLDSAGSYLVSAGVFSDVSSIATSKIEQVATITTNVKNSLNNLQSAVDTLFNIYRWILLPVCIATLVILLVLVLVTVLFRCPAYVPFTMAIIGLIVVMILWLSLGVTIVADTVANDICLDMELIIRGHPDGDPLMKAFECNRDLTQNQYWPVFQTVVDSGTSAAQDMCETVRSRCISGIFLCDALPSNCTSAAVAEASTVTARLARNASQGGCDNQCPISQCPTLCSSSEYRQATTAYEQAREAGQALKRLYNSTLDPLINCTVWREQLFRRLQTVCDVALRGWALALGGQVILGVAGIIGMACLIVMADWFHSTKPEHTSQEKVRDPKRAAAAGEGSKGGPGPEFGFFGAAAGPEMVYPEVEWDQEFQPTAAATPANTDIVYY